MGECHWCVGLWGTELLTLRPYQEAGLAALESFVAAGGKTPLLAWSTGLGKTVAFAHWRAKRAGRALIIAHRDELLEQAADKLRAVGVNGDLGIVKAERNDCGADTVLASIQTLARGDRLGQCLTSGPFSTVVIDEAHHSEAPTYRHVIRTLQAFGDPPILGVTATPARADKKALGRTWQRVVHRMSILDGIKQGYLCDLRAKRIRVDADFASLRARGGDVVESEAERMLLDANAPQMVAQAIHAHALTRTTLVFCAGVELAHRTAAACTRLGFESGAVDGTTGREARHDLLDRFRTGTLQVLANCNVLTEGYDEPRADCIVIARPTMSQPLYAQMVGRGTRTFPGKTDCLVLDVVGATMRHDLVTLPQLFTEELGSASRDAVSAGRGLLEALAEGEGIADDIEIVGRDFAWVNLPKGWVLSLGGKAMLYLDEIKSGWAVRRRDEYGDESVWSGTSLEYAQGIAEDEVRRADALKLVARDAPWRQVPASVAQLQALARFGVRIPNGMTKGEAADQLTRKIAALPVRR